MGDHQQVPALIENISGIANDVLVAAVLGWQEIAAPCIVTASCESATYDGGKFAGDKDPHSHRAPAGMDGAVFTSPAPPRGH